MHSDLQSAADDAGLSMAGLLRRLVQDWLDKSAVPEDESSDE